jgi:hypothetical protein
MSAIDVMVVADEGVPDADPWRPWCQARAKPASGTATNRDRRFR